MNSNRKTSTEDEKKGNFSSTSKSPYDRKEWRSVLYKLSASGLSYPEKPMIKELASGKFLTGMLKVSRIFDLGLEERVLEVRESLKDRPIQPLAREVESEYVRLFVADTGGARVKPFGAYYLDGEVMGDSVKKVTSLYSKSGMVKTEDYQGQPDHVSVELEFLFKLTQSSLEKKYRLHAEFYDELLQPWLDEFKSRVVEETNHGFYSLLAKWVQESLEADRELVEEINNSESAGFENG